MYFTVFLYGYLARRAMPAFWAETGAPAPRGAGVAAGLFAAYLALVFGAARRRSWPVQAVVLDAAQRSTSGWCCCAILGWAHALLNRPFRWLPWANEAVYPWYMLHQSLIVLFAYWLLPLQLGPVLEPLLVLAGTIAGCWLLHELVIAACAGCGRCSA